MDKQQLTDFERGYAYAKLRHGPLLLGKTPEAILELAAAFLTMPGGCAELARGIGEYYRELALKARNG